MLEKKKTKKKNEMDGIIIKVWEVMDHGWVVFFVHWKFSRTHKKPTKTSWESQFVFGKGSNKVVLVRLACITL